MIRGIGIDLCEVARMRTALEKDGFLARFFTAGEAAYIHERGQGAAESLAGHFAAKEAAVKALGLGLAIPLGDIEICHRPEGAPYYVLRGKALARLETLGGKTIHLSITHTSDTAAAVAIVEG